ncbi:MAG: quinolinate synthase NadA [Prolixibacteraceae bacterium]|nr:quinolinate synthase NadA [Prolixibacteraceae bacterium]
METLHKTLEENGFVDEVISPDVNIIEEINRLRKEKNAAILSHYYVRGALQDIADFVGDSLGLSHTASETGAEIIVFVGVHFMGETAKIINPSKKVIVPDLKAGCSLADSVNAGDFMKFKAQHPDHKVISYINCTAELKTMSDIICTSANALKIVESFPKEQPLIFAPDKNLGNYINTLTGRQMVLWNGSCIVHEKYSVEGILKLMNQYPDASFIAHPECEAPVLVLAEFVGSTTALLAYVGKSRKKRFIVATESGIFHQMRKENPGKTFIPAPSVDSTCGCDDCAYMKLNTLEKLYLCMKYEQPEITIAPEIIEKAIVPIRRMLEI